MAMRTLPFLLLLTGALLAQTPADKAAEAKEALKALDGWTKMSNAEKSAAIGKVAAVGGPQVAGALAPKLHDKEPAIRKEVAAALGKLKEDRAVPALITALEVDADEKTGDVDAFVAICAALGEIGDPRAIQPLVHGVLGGNRRDPNWQKRADARVEALGGIRHKDAIEELLGLWTRGAASSGRSATGGMRGGANSNPLSAGIASSLNKLTGQKLTDQKAYHDWWKANKQSFQFKK